MLRAFRDGPCRAPHADDRRGDGARPVLASTSSIASPSRPGPARSPARALASQPRARLALARGAQRSASRALPSWRDGCQARDHTRPDAVWRSPSMRGAAKSTRSFSRPTAASPQVAAHAAVDRRGRAARRRWPDARSSVRAGSGRGAAASEARPVMRAHISRTCCPTRRRWRTSPRRFGPPMIPLAPFYLRAPDAKPQDGKSIARAGHEVSRGPPLDPKNLSLLWASPELVADIAALHGAPLRSAVGRGQHLRA